MCSGANGVARFGGAHFDVSIMTDDVEVIVIPSSGDHFAMPRQPPQPSPFLAPLCAAALGLAACFGGGSHPPGQCGLVMDAGMGGPAYFDIHDDLLFPGTRSVFAEPVRFGVCPPGYDYPAVSGVAVTAPGGAALEATWHRDLSGAVAVDFTTAELGEHAVSVTYAPDPATGQPPTTFSTTVVTARDHGGAARLGLPLRCAELHRTEPGTWICDEQVIRGGAMVGALDVGWDAGWRYAVDGASLWGATRQGEVARWLDTGAGPLLGVNRLSASELTGPVSAVVGSGDEVLVRSSGRLDRYVMPADGGPARAAGWLAIPGTGTVAWNGGRELLVAEAEGSVFVGRVCAYRLEGDAIVASAAPCEMAQAAGASSGEMWGNRGNDEGLDLYRAEDGGIAHVAWVRGPGDLTALYSRYPGESGFLYFPLSYPRRKAYAIFPVIVAPGTAALDAFDLHGGYRGARRDFVWTDMTTDAGTTTEVIFR